MPFDYCQIREFRGVLGLTQTQLADKLQVPQCTVARWETGRTAPNASHIGEMCDFGRVAGIEPGFFFPAFSRCTPGQGGPDASTSRQTHATTHTTTRSDTDG